MPTASLQNEAVKGLEATEVSSFRDLDSLSLGTPDLSSNTVSMKASKNCDCSGTKIQPMKVKPAAGSPIRSNPQKTGYWPEFNVLTTVRRGPCLNSGKETRKVLWICHERFAMIREWKRNQSPARQPATHTAQNQAVSQFAVARSRRRKNGRAVPVGPRHGLQPTGGVKHTRARLPAQEFGPPRICQRISLVDHRVIVSETPLGT
jgi:hypothetical protein